jgi:methyltransferase (TIGR00027 family)
MAELKESRTAIGVAWLRAAHQVLDSQPLILKDEPVVDLLGRHYVERLAREPERLQTPGARLLRSHVVLRSRFAEDRLEQSLSRGVEQYVILGAGYDTFFARQPAWAKKELRIFEIDQPATQADKLARIAAAGMGIPSNVAFGSVNFEAESVADAFRRLGVSFDAPTVFSWLGVTMYLTEAAIDATLNAAMSFPRGSEIVLTFASRETENLPDGPAASSTSTDDLETRATLASIVAGIGEPWITYYEPEQIEHKLCRSGFSDVLLVTPEIANERYFAGRSDALPPPRKTSLLSAIV